MTTHTTPTAEEVREQLTVALIFRPARPDGIVLIKRQAAYPLDAVTAGLVGSQREPDTTWRVEQVGDAEWVASLADGGLTITGTYGHVLTRPSDRGLWER